MARRVAVAALLLPFLLALASPAAHAQTPKRGGVIRIAEREAPGPRSAPVDQLPHALLREPQLQPARALPQRARAEEPDGFLDPARPRREVDGVQGRQGLHLRPAQGREVPQQAAGERPRGHGRGREVLARAVHGQVRLPHALRAGERHRGGGQAHRAHHAQGAVRAVPQPPRQPVVLRHPAARGRGEVQGLQPSRRRHRHRAVRAEVVREGRARRLRAQSRLLHEGPAVPRRRRHRDHARRRRPRGRAASGQGRPAAHLGLGEPGGRQGAPEDQSRAGHRPRTRSSARASSTCAPTSRPSTTSGCGAPCRWPSTARRGTRRCCSARAASTPGPVPCALKDWKLDAVQDRRRPRPSTSTGYDPAEAKKLLAEAGLAKGFTTPIFHWPGYVRALAQLLRAGRRQPRARSASPPSSSPRSTASTSRRPRSASTRRWPWGRRRRSPRSTTSSTAASTPSCPPTRAGWPTPS